MKRLSLFVTFCFLVMSQAALSFAHEGEKHDSLPAPELGPMTTGFNGLSLWGHTGMVTVVVIILIVGGFLVLYFHQLKHQREKQNEQ